jgi:hypothetical protein
MYGSYLTEMFSLTEHKLKDSQCQFKVQQWNRGYLKTLGNVCCKNSKRKPSYCSEVGNLILKGSGIATFYKLFCDYKL